MLETVRIRRAGYNVRLTYDEFIHLYRTLLPKGLISSQKDVRDFMNLMDLNKQDYQLGLTKIYMRESSKKPPKAYLDDKLHTQILNSIIKIQRWFRSILQRKKYLSQRTAAVTIQSFWRMFLSQKQMIHYKEHNNAAVVIQAAWRMYATKKWYTQLKNGVVFVQSWIRGRRARVKFKANLRQQVREKQIKIFKYILLINVNLSFYFTETS